MGRKSAAFEKRVKRRVSGPHQTFYAVCQPGLEPVCHAELTANGISAEEITTGKGGLEFTTRLARVVELNLNMASPSRILMRIGSFKADSFGRLEKKIAGIDWELYLPKNVSLNVKAAAKKSRLYHSDAIAQRCRAMIDQHLQKYGVFETPLESSVDQTLYVRAERNRFTISLDSSGELLYRRGIKQHVTAAPLRENIAFAMLFRASFSKEDLLLDPMCGSGTFSLEAALIKSGLPPGFFRSFAFESWPAFSPNAFAYLKNQADITCRSGLHKEIFASDIDVKAVDSILKNLSDPRLREMIQVEETDFFTISPDRYTSRSQSVIMLNPPYGKRLKTGGSALDSFSEIGRKLKKDFRNWRAGIIVPDRSCADALGIPLDFYPVFHGGMDVFIGTGKIKS